MRLWEITLSDKERLLPDDSQIIIALNELLEYFNKK